MQHEQDQPVQPSYDFIFNAAQPQKPSRFKSPLRGSFASRIGVIMGGAVVVVVLLFALGTVLGSGKQAARQSLLAVAQLQQELARVAGAVATDASNQAVKNVAITTELGMTSSNATLSDALSADGITFEEQELVFPTADETDTTLDDAKTAGTYDATAIKTLDTTLAAYMTALQTAFEAVSDATVKDALRDNYQAAKLIAQQL